MVKEEEPVKIPTESREEEWPGVPMIDSLNT